MSEIFEWKDTSIFYEKRENEIVILGVKGTPAEVEIPDKISGLPVTRIQKKAFLSVRGLYYVKLPDTICEIGEWAFAYTKSLEEVSLPGREILFGKDLFLGCDRLHKITFRNYEKRSYNEDVAFLTAHGVIDLNASFLCNPLEAGTEDWYRMYDDRLIDYLKKDDMEGFAELWTCGEEDYEGKDYNAYSFPNEKRKKKVKACFFRLIHKEGLSENAKEAFETYLQNHTALKEQEETWEIMEDEYGSSYDHYRLFVETGCLNDENFDEIMNRLDRLGQKNPTKLYPEMKAYFIRFKQPEEAIGVDTFFDAFSLDDL